MMKHFAVSLSYLINLKMQDDINKGKKFYDFLFRRRLKKNLKCLTLEHNFKHDKNM